MRHPEKLPRRALRASALTLVVALGSASPHAAAEPKPPPQSSRAQPAKRVNCGTFWTGWTEDPNTNVNPCPKNCERGERELVNTGKRGGTIVYEARYRCYAAAASTAALTTGRLAFNGLRPVAITTAPLQMSGSPPRIILTGTLRMSGPRPRDITTAPLLMSGKH